VSIASSIGGGKTRRCKSVVLDIRRGARSRARSRASESWSARCGHRERVPGGIPRSRSRSRSRPRGRRRKSVADALARSARAEDLLHLFLLHLFLPPLNRVQQTARGQSVSQSDVRHPIRLERERGIASRQHGICRLPSRRTAALIPRTRARRESKENNRYAESGEERRGEERRGEKRRGEERREERRRREEEQSRGEQKENAKERGREKTRAGGDERIRSALPRLPVSRCTLARSRVPGHLIKRAQYRAHGCPAQRGGGVRGR